MRARRLACCRGTRVRRNTAESESDVGKLSAHWFPNSRRCHIAGDAPDSLPLLAVLPVPLAVAAACAACSTGAADHGALCTCTPSSARLPVTPDCSRARYDGWQSVQLALIAARFVRHLVLGACTAFLDGRGSCRIRPSWRGARARGCACPAGRRRVPMLQLRVRSVLCHSVEGRLGVMRLVGVRNEVGIVLAAPAGAVRTCRTAIQRRD